MKRLARSVPVLVFLVLWPLGSPPGVHAQRGDHPPHNSFELSDFALEGGETLGDAQLLYVTHGELNADRSNAILLPSFYLGNHHGYDFLIGPDLALDPDRYFVIVTELFSSGGSSSPSNTPPPQDRENFPSVTIRDNVEATYRLVTEQFGITHLRAVVGHSMGAQQAFQWAVSHPDFMDLIVPIAGTAKTYPHGVVRLESALTLITGDPSMVAGHDTLSTAGRAAWAYHWAAWTRSTEYWRQGLFRRNNVTTVEAFLERTARTFPSSRPQDFVVQGRTWQGHDIGDTPGFDGDVERALASIRVPVLYMPGATDMYFPITDAEYERAFIPDVDFVPIPSINGHMAGSGSSAEDREFINDAIRQALR
jgi:homoserine O-acetyltransferase